MSTKSGMLSAVARHFNRWPGRGWVPAALGAVLCATGASAQLAEPWALTNFTSGVAVTDAHGNDPGGNYYYGETYFFNISFAEDGVKQFEYDSLGRLRYALPPELEVVFEITDEPILLDNGLKCGQYDVDAAGNVAVWFDDVDNTGNATYTNFIHRYPNVVFALEIQAKFDPNVTPGSILFGGGGSVTVSTITDPPAGLRVAKHASPFSVLNESIDYTVVITAVGGDIQNITLDDTMRLTGEAIPGGFNVDSGVVNVSWQHNDGTPTGIPATWAGANNDILRFSFGSQVLQKNSTLTLRYTLNWGDVIDGLLPFARNNNRYRFDLNLANTATATGETASSGESVGDSAMVPTRLKKDLLIKDTDWSNSASSPNHIAWVCIVGDGSMRLNGMTLVDILGASPAHEITGDINVMCGGMEFANGDWDACQGEILSPPYAGVLSSITDFDAQKGFSYVVPDGIIGYPDIYRVAFLYETLVTEPSMERYVNSIGIVVGGVTNTISQQLDGPDGWNSCAVRDYEWVATGGSAVINAIKYTTTFTVPAGSEGKEFLFLEYLDFLPYDDDGIAVPGYRINPLIPKEYFNVNISTNDPDFYCATHIEEDTWRNNNVFFTFGFDGDAESKNIWESQPWPYSDEQTVTITYTIPLDAPLTLTQGTINPEPHGNSFTPPNSWTGTLRKYYEAPNFHENYRVWRTSLLYVDFNYNFYYGDYITDAIYPVVKTVTQSAPGVFDYTLTWNKSIHNFMFLDTDEEPVIFLADLDPRLEYVAKSFKIEKWDYAQFVPGTGPECSTFDELVEDLDSAWFKVDGETGSIWADLRGFSAMLDGWAGNDDEYGLANWDNPHNVWNPANQDGQWWWGRHWADGIFTYGTEFTIQFQMRVKEEFANDEFTVRDTLAMIGNSPRHEGIFPAGLQHGDDPEPPTYGEPPIVKTYTRNNSNVINVEIVINEQGRDLVPDGPGANKESFTATDVMGGDLAFYFNTVELWTREELSPGVWDETWVKTNAVYIGGLWSAEFVDANTITFLLPNETPIRITYKMLVTLPVGETASFHNTLTVFDLSDGFSDNNFTVLGVGATASGSDQEVIIFKRDRVTQELLDGASFTTWGAMPDGSVPLGAISQFLTRSICGKTFYEMDMDTIPSPATGVYPQYGNNIFYYNSPVIYAFEEVDIPQGYAEPAVPYTFFVLGARDVTALENELGQTVQTVADTVTIFNDLLSVQIGFDPNDGGPAPVVRDTFYHGQNYSPPAQDPVWGDRAFLGWFLGLQRVTSGTEITRFDDHDVLGMWLDPRDDLDTGSPDIGDLIPPPGTPGVTNGAPVIIVIVIDNGDGTTTTNNVTGYLEGDDNTDGPYTIVIDDEGGLPEGDGTITNIIVNPEDEDELDLETDIPITVNPAGDPPTGSVWYIPEGAYYYTRLTDEVLAVYTPPTPLAGDLSGTMVRVLFSVNEFGGGEGFFEDGLVPTVVFDVFPTGYYEDAYLRARPDGKYDVINPYPISDDFIIGYMPEVQEYDYYVTFSIAGDANTGDGYIRLYTPPESEVEYISHYTLETDADLGWYFRGDLFPNTGGFAVENDLTRDDLIHGIIYTNSAKTLGVPFTGYIHDEYFLPEDDVAKARPLHRIIADELPGLPEDDYEVVIFFDNTLPWPGSPCDQNYDPLAAEHCWFIEGTVRLGARDEFRYEFANVLYAERPYQSPATYFPEFPLYSDNWLSREGTVTFAGWPATDVKLEDNTAQAGENSGTVLIDGTIPRIWARGMAYPTRIDLAVTDYEGDIHHVGTSLEYIFIALAPGVSANTDLAPDGNGSIGHYTLPGDLNPADTALTYPGDIPAKHPDGKLIVTLYVTDGNEGSSIIPPDPIVGPIHGYIDTNGNIVPTDEFGNVIEFPYFPPGDGYHLVVIAEERGTPRKLGWGPFNRAPGTVDYVDGVNPEDDDIIIGKFDPPVGFDGDPSELDVVVIIDGEPVEGAWIDEEGNIHIPGLPDGIEPGSTIEVEIIIKDGNGDELYSNEDDPETLDVYTPSGVTITDPLEVDDDETDITIGTFDPGDDPKVPLDNGTNVVIVIIDDQGNEWPVDGSIDEDGNITIDEIPEGLFGEDLDVIVTVTDDNGNPMGDGKGKITIRKGRIRIADAATAEEDDPIVGKYTDHGIDDPDVLTNLVVEVWIGAEGPFPGYIDGDGNIRVRGRIPERLVGDDVPIEIVISDTVEGKDGPAKRVYNRQSGLIDIIAPTQDGALRITSITLTTDSSQKDWITITVDGCYNWSKAYSLFGDSVLARQADPANTDQIGDANWYRPTKVQAQAHAEAIFTFPKPVDAHFFYHAREIPR
ncbi:MAG: hypothetical protein FWG50_09580 [Kiritimatiellaeota bacterium]|nr:hypothetical protein [Kiritimatiellota bacterium]